MHKTPPLINEILEQVREAILRIQRRFSGIESPEPVMARITAFT